MLNFSLTKAPFSEFPLPLANFGGPSYPSLCELALPLRDLLSSRMLLLTYLLYKLAREGWSLEVLENKFFARFRGLDFLKLQYPLPSIDFLDDYFMSAVQAYHIK